MKDLKLNDQCRYIFAEAIEDCRIGMKRGDGRATSAMSYFKRWLKEDCIPVSDLDFAWGYYQNNKDGLSQNTDPRLEGLITEVNYMINYLNSNYEFIDMEGGLCVRERE